MMQLILLAFDPILLLVASGNEPKCHSKMPDCSRSPAKRRWLHSFISQQELSLRRRLNDEQNHVSCLQLCLRRMPSMHVNTWPSHRLPEAEHAASLVNSHELHIITRGKQRNRFNMRKHIRDDFLITFMALLSMNVWKLLSSDVFLYLTIFNVHSMNEFGGLEPLGWQRSCLDS